MTKYLDKDFFRFLFGFIVIVSFSVIIILATRLYEEQALKDRKANTANVLDSSQP